MYRNFPFKDSRKESDTDSSVTWPQTETVTLPVLPGGEQIYFWHSPNLKNRLRYFGSEEPLMISVNNLLRLLNGFKTREGQML